jgi:C_GCAxxG_C_C family probable redox protein
MSRSERATEQFESGLNCAQAVFTSFIEGDDIDENLACHMAAGFGGGMGRTGGTCGAVTGAILALGYLDRESDSKRLPSRLRAYLRVQEFCREFEEKHGSLNCRELLGYDIGTPEGCDEIERQGLIRSRCSGFVSDAVEMIEDIL